MTQALVKLQEEEHSMHTQMKKLDKLSSVVWVSSLRHLSRPYEERIQR